MKLSKVFVAAAFITAVLAAGSAKASAYSVEEERYLAEYNGTYISPFIMFGEIGKKWGGVIGAVAGEVTGEVAGNEVAGPIGGAVGGAVMEKVGEKAGEYLGDKIEDHVVRPIIDRFRKDK